MATQLLRPGISQTSQQQGANDDASASVTQAHHCMQRDRVPHEPHQFRRNRRPREPDVPQRPSAHSNGDMPLSSDAQAFVPGQASASSAVAQGIHVAPPSPQAPSSCFPGGSGPPDQPPNDPSNYPQSPEQADDVFDPWRNASRAFHARPKPEEPVHTAAWSNYTGASRETRHAPPQTGPQQAPFRPSSAHRPAESPSFMPQAPQPQPQAQGLSWQARMQNITSRIFSGLTGNSHEAQNMQHHEHLYHPHEGHLPTQEWPMPHESCHMPSYMPSTQWMQHPSAHHSAPHDVMSNQLPCFPTFAQSTAQNMSSMPQSINFNGNPFASPPQHFHIGTGPLSGHHGHHSTSSMLAPVAHLIMAIKFTCPGHKPMSSCLQHIRSLLTRLLESMLKDILSLSHHGPQDHMQQAFLLHRVRMT